MLMRPGMRYSSSSVIAGAGGEGSRISMSSFRGLSSAPRPFAQQSSVVTVRGAGDKETMKDLNNRLDKYLSRVRTLEESNKELEDKIKEELLKRGTVGGRDWSAYDEPLADLRAQVATYGMITFNHVGLYFWRYYTVIAAIIVGYENVRINYNFHALIQMGR